MISTMQHITSFAYVQSFNGYSGSWHSGITKVKVWNCKTTDFIIYWLNQDHALQ